MPELRLAIEVQADAVSAVVVRRGLKSNQVLAHARANGSANGLQQTVDQALSTLSGKTQIGGAVCTASFPAHLVSFRNLELPFGDSKRIRQTLPFELEPTLPLPVEQTVADFHVVRRSDRTTLIAASVEREALHNYFQLLAPHKLSPEVLDIEAVPTVLLLIRNGVLRDEGVFASVDTDRAVLILFGSGKILLIRSVPISPDQERAPRKLCGEVARTMRGYRESSGEPFEPSGLFVTGGGLASEGMRKGLSEGLGLPVTPVDVARATQTSIAPSSGAPWNPLLMDGALALALNEPGKAAGFNLRQGPFALRKKWQELRKHMTRAGVLAAAVFLSLFARFYADAWTMRAETARLDGQIEALFKETIPEATRIVDPLKQMKVRIDELKRAASMPGETERQVRVVDLLRSISERIPKELDVKLQTFIASADGIQIAGETDTFNSVDTIKGGLEGAPILEKVTIVSADIDRGGNRVRFKIRAQASPDGGAGK